MNRFRKTFYRQNPATSCLREAKIAELREKDAIYMPEAPDPELIQERDFEKYIALDSQEITVDQYDKAEVEYYQNINNKNWDEITAELVRNTTIEKMFAGGDEGKMGNLHGGNIGNGGNGGNRGNNGNYGNNGGNKYQQQNMAMVNPAFFMQ